MIKKRNEYIYAKLNVTLRKILDVSGKEKVLEIYDKYIDYQKRIYMQLQNFELVNVSNQDLYILKRTLENQSLFYSYCFDHYNLLPPLLVSLGYKVVILVSDTLLKNMKNFIDKEIERYLIKTGKNVSLLFLTNTTTNLLFKLKQEVEKGSKVLMFVDGNKGSFKEKKNNLLLTDFKGHKILFHQGFGVLSYILGYDTLTGILIRSDKSKIRIKILNNNIDRGLNLKKYIALASELLVKHLDNTLHLDNIHLWNSLLSVHEWFVISDDIEGDEYVPFKLGNREYYAIEHDTFKIYPIEKKEYMILKKC
jgi:hypothetical protein